MGRLQRGKGSLKETEVYEKRERKGEKEWVILLDLLSRNRICVAEGRGPCKVKMGNNNGNLFLHCM